MYKRQDLNHARDIFVYDRRTGQISRVSVSSAGEEANDDSFKPTISADGGRVAFHSEATNLVPGDSNGCWDVFVHDRATGQTRCASLDWQGAPGNDHSIQAKFSANGRYVIFHSRAALVPDDTNGQWDVYVYDVGAESIARISVGTLGEQGNSWSEHATISGDGAWAAYHSAATTLVPGDSNGVVDVFLYEARSQTTTRISLAYDGGEANGTSSFPCFSADGRFVAFDSEASNLVPGDTNGVFDVFVYELASGRIRRVSVNSQGGEGNGDSMRPFLSADGRYVTFFSGASNLVPGDWNGALDVFVHDCQTGQTSRVSVRSDGGEANGGSSFATISGDGRYVAFHSFATNLALDDTNWKSDVFVHWCWPSPSLGFIEPIR